MRRPDLLAPRPLFLRWLVQEAVFVVLAAVLAITGFATGVNGPPLVALVVILLVSVAVTVWCGVLSWRADGALASTGVGRTLSRIKHDAEHIFYSVAVFQILGMIGATLGYKELTHVSATGQAGIDAINIGLGNGLTPTIAGMLISLVAGLQHHLLAHAIERQEI